MCAENFTGQPRWLPEVVVEVAGPLSYQVEFESGNTVRRHVDSVRKRYASGDEETLTDVQDNDPLFLPESQDILANSSSPTVDSLQWKFHPNI